MVQTVLAVSLALQLTAAFLSLRLIRITGGRIAWLLLAGAILLMAVRRSITLFQTFGSPPGDPAAEWVALAISALMAAGIGLIGPVFRAYRTTEAKLEAVEKERTLLEAELFRAQKMEALGRLAGGVAHDFNNMLTIVLGNADVGRREVPVDHPARELFEQIHLAATRAGELTRQLLTFSRRQPVEARSTDLNAVVARAETLLRRVLGSHVSLSVRLEAEPSWVRVDEVRIEQLLMNLAVNARDAMSGGGRLTIGTTRLAAGDGAPGARVELTVRDTGSGIPPEMRDRIFEPFFSTKPAHKGSGLGLTVVYGVVTQAGGTIEIDSQPGEGTVFKVRLPACDEAPEAAPPAATSPRPAPAPRTILVAEDEAAIRKFIVLALSEAGYRVLEASDGEEALAVAATAAEPPTLLLADSQMPRAGGAELARRLKEQHPALKVVVMSGYSEVPVAAGTYDAWLSKPFTVETLLSAVTCAAAAGRSPAPG